MYITLDRAAVQKEGQLKRHPRDLRDIQPVSTTRWAWDRLRRLLGLRTLYSLALPLPNPLWLPITDETLVQRTLAKFNITKIGNLYPDDHIFFHI